MSDRVAVFHDGRIAQIGTPEEIYERPGSPFVAGFVGTSNLLQGQTAMAVLGSDGTYSVRPEKISIEPAEASAAPDDGEVTAKGAVVEVIYAGPSTRFVVDLDAGARLVALQQNLETSSSEVNRLRNTQVILRWRREHVVAIPTEAHRAAVPSDDATQ